ncbi:MAG TPA: hypothetical protein VD999_01545 [Vitreimonas sp.]|nr:hypothetical protein [Vitreimonas sp.]
MVNEDLIQVDERFLAEVQNFLKNPRYEQDRSELALFLLQYLTSATNEEGFSGFDLEMIKAAVDAKSQASQDEVRRNAVRAEMQQPGNVLHQIFERHPALLKNLRIFAYTYEGKPAFSVVGRRTTDVHILEDAGIQTEDLFSSYCLLVLGENIKNGLRDIQYALAVAAGYPTAWAVFAVESSWISAFEDLMKTMGKNLVPDEELKNQEGARLAEGIKARTQFIGQQIHWKDQPRPIIDGVYKVSNQVE